MALALGRTPEEETQENLAKVSAELLAPGSTALYFSSRPQVRFLWKDATVCGRAWYIFLRAGTNLGLDGLR